MANAVEYAPKFNSSTFASGLPKNGVDSWRTKKEAAPRERGAAF